MKKPQQTLALIDIEKVQKRLPPKKPRSHHEVVRLRYVNKSVLVGKNKISILKDIKLVFTRGSLPLSMVLRDAANLPFCIQSSVYCRPTKVKFFYADVKFTR
jgi:hypothetical protein